MATAGAVDTQALEPTAQRARHAGRIITETGTMADAKLPKESPASFMWIDRQPEIISMLARIETKVDKLTSKMLDLEGQVLEYIERTEQLCQSARQGQRKSSKPR